MFDWLPGGRWRRMLHAQMRWLGYRIGVLERQLEDDFALLETAPLIAELDDLRTRHERLRRRLTRRT